MIGDSFLGLEGQHVLILGASGGIGYDLARRFLLQGAKVTVHYNSNIKPLEPLLKEFPTKTIALQADATNEESVIDLFKKSTEALGVINILIANHAILNTEPVEIAEMSLARWKKTIDVNVTGVFLFVREFLRHMKTHLKTLNETDFLNFRECNIVIIGSIAGKAGKAFNIEYSTSKSALMYGFTKSLKNEIVKIHPKARVNVVAPAWIKTAMAEESIKRGYHFSSLQTMPLKKLATTDDVSNAVLFLSSSKASGHITGTVIEVDGGMDGRVVHKLEDVINYK